MHPVIRFTTDMFDVTRERPNDINPIYGESLLLWLAERAKGAVAISAPAAEDWGWYVDIDWKGRGYMLGSSASRDETGQMEWVLQVVKHRSLSERLLRREKLTQDDECVRFFRQMLEREPAFSNLTVE